MGEGEQQRAPTGPMIGMIRGTRPDLYFYEPIPEGRALRASAEGVGGPCEPANHSRITHMGAGGKAPFGLGGLRGSR